jgi:UDP-N-acetylglucosamine acyltransferase
MIHPTAVIHPKAQLDSTVVVGPYAVVDEHVVVGPHCHLGPHVYLTGHTTIGAHNRFHAGCVIGGVPQDLKYRDAPSRLRIGDHNVFRECFTANCSLGSEGATVVGSHNFLMAQGHIGHDAVLGNHIILANCSLIAGHVVVGDRAFLSGNVCVHQFVRVGTLSILQGGTCLTLDLPPFTVLHGVNRLCGLNVIGLRRAGYTSEQRLELKRLYHALFRSRKKLRAALADAQAEFTSEPARVLMEFVATAKRGLCHDQATGAYAGAED